MCYRPLAALLVVFLIGVCAPPVRAQQCVPYEPDPRLEPYDAMVPSAWMAADALVVGTIHLTPQDDGTYRMRVFPWTYLKSPWGEGPACRHREYHEQPGELGVGGAVLVGTDVFSSDRVLTARHVIHDPQTGANICDVEAFVFGYGNFSPNQWQATCLSLEYCYVTVPGEDVYFCEEYWEGSPDWAVVRLDRRVAGRTPLPIRDESYPPNPVPGPDNDMVLISHPNRIPMKVEYVDFLGLNSYTVDGRILSGSSGGMAIDSATGEVVGVVSTGWGYIWWDEDTCAAPICKRELFSSPSAQAGLQPAYPAAPYIP